MRPQTIVERLDFVAKRIPGLKFTPPTQLKPGDDQGCFMSCDMYYIEIKVDQSHQSVKDVVISHGNNADEISCPVLRKVLADQDFETFAKHLAGLHSIYQISTHDKKVKQRAYPALTALERDLTILYDHQRRRTNNCHDLVHKSPIGIMEPRKGGLPVRLTYFITPYDLVDTTHKGLIDPTINNVIDRNLGLSATVEIEGSSPHKLQVKSLISTQSSLPAYAPFNSQNSEKLPAQFVLKLSQPFPMLNTSISQIINEINEPPTIKEYLTSLTTNSKESLVSLIARQELDLNKGPFCRSVDVLKGADSDSCDLSKHVYSIKLLDQCHTYHILDNYLERQDGVYVTKVPFTHPTSIPKILSVLRQQALFNFLIGSCIRRNKNNGNSNMFDENTSKITHDSNIFDIIPVNLNNICIAFEHPSKESLATLEIDFKELSCQLHALDKESVCSNEFATKVLQKCWSIPITLRSVMKKCNERRLALLEDANKRRERELQELLLLTNNSSQQGVQYKSHLQYQETLLQSKFNSLHDKSISRDLNSMTEFLSSKINYASTSDACNQTNTNTDSDSIRSNLLKKYSCKPKAKQSTTTKNQIGNNKILSLMLKRQNSSTSSIDDTSLKATLTKKAKIKSVQSELGAKNSGITTTKLISSEVATAARLASKQAKQHANNQTVSVSLIRSPNKSQIPITASSSASSSSTGMVSTPQSLVAASSSKQFEAPLFGPVNPNSNNRIKSQSNGNNNVGKSRKGSVCAVLDNLVGGVTPEQNMSSHPSSSNDVILEPGNKNPESSKGSPLGAKSKTRTPADQFAIKQGSEGSLKLTVTKTKPTTAPSSSSTSNSVPTATFSSSSSNNVSVKSETNKILQGLGATPNIKYTIPKISKTQQASSQPGSNSQTNSTDNQNSITGESNSQSDDSGNPSSSANTSSAPSSTTNKRTTSTPFNRANNSNRNSVSSSTHPRTTSNPLANTGSRPSSTSTNENHLLNRITNCNLNQQNMRQQITHNNRMVNMHQQQQQQQQVIQRMVNPSIVTAPQPSQQLLNQTAMFALSLSQQQSSFQNTNDINLIAANQAALLNQQRNQNLQNSNQQLSGHFMSSSVDANLISSSRPQFATTLQQPVVPTQASNLNASGVGDSMQRPAPSALNSAPQFYIRQPMFDDPSSAVSSTPRVTSEPSQSSFAINDSNHAPPTTSVVVPTLFQPRLNESPATNAAQSGNMGEMSSSTMPGQTLGPGGGQGVSSSSDSGSQGLGPTISTPSSPTECGHAETVPPPPLIPIDSLEEPQAYSPETDNPDDASDRLSIVDMNENIADSISTAGTPKPSSANSPLNAQDSNSATPSSSSRTLDSAAVVTSANNGPLSGETTHLSARNTTDTLFTTQSPATSTTSDGSAVVVAQSSTATNNDESSALSRVQSSNVLGLNDEPVGPQSTMAATTSDMI